VPNTTIGATYNFSPNDPFNIVFS